MPEGKPSWHYTEFLKADPRWSKPHSFEEPDQEAPHGYIGKWRVIGRDTPINKGMYAILGLKEIIIVDDELGELDEVYQELLKRRQQAVNKEQTFKQGVLEEVYKLTMEKLPYSQKTVDKVAQKFGVGFFENARVPLGVYVNYGGGVCRHQALLSGYLFERLQREGFLQGKVSIDRNYIPGQGGHAWVRYTNSIGKVYIIDPAQEYIGPLDEVKEGRWFYERPEDKTSA